MRRIFIDALHLIAIINRHDQWHQSAIKMSQTLIGCRFFTTEEVLTEFLTAYCEAGPIWRRRSSAYVRDLYRNRDVTILPQSSQSFLAGLNFYEARNDKQYSLTDCISMASMRQEGIVEILTNDAHFVQEGFIKLL